MNRYLITIDSLNTLNIDLTSKLDKTSSALDETQSERDELRKQNEQNAELLTKGAKLNAFNFNSEALRYQTFGGSTKSVNRAARAEYYRVPSQLGKTELQEQETRPFSCRLQTLMDKLYTVVQTM